VENHYFKVQVHERKGHLKLPCSLTRQGKNCECIQHTRECIQHTRECIQHTRECIQHTRECIQHTRSSLSLYWAATGFYFINQPLCA